MQWLKKYQKYISLGLGALLLLVGVAMLFWSYGESAMSKEERLAAASVARMEARMQSQLSGGKTAPPPKASIFAEEYKEKQKQQLRYGVIAMLIIGVGLMGYGFLRKEDEAAD